MNLSPKNRRASFAKMLIALGGIMKRKFGGFIRRVDSNTLEVTVVTEKVNSDRELGQLWGVLGIPPWNVDVGTLERSFELANYTEAHFLFEKFQVLQPDGEEWSNRLEEFDEVASQFSYVTSLK